MHASQILRAGRNIIGTEKNSTVAPTCAFIKRKWWYIIIFIDFTEFFASYYLRILF